jgi:hypothetical protein
MRNGSYQLDLSVPLHQALQTILFQPLFGTQNLFTVLPSIVSILSKQNKLVVSSSSKINMYTSYCQVKAHRLPFVSSSTVVTAPLQIVHTDLWDQLLCYQILKISTMFFLRSILSLSWIYYCACKSDKLFAQFKFKVENLLSHKIKIMHCDGGIEFKPLLTQYPEIQFHIFCTYTPEQNGLVERKHRHLLNLALQLRTEHQFLLFTGIKFFKAHYLLLTDCLLNWTLISPHLKNFSIIHLIINS